ncbi:MAG TPA: YicC/YloC family endoribonuclease [Gemmatimonadaceae bacterium]|nr:YicC/YloC family endoribonuclease [Gemmatimonadaceae bacterium]
MTGFGSATGRVGSRIVTVEVRTVNHRFFNPSIKLPTALARWEGEMRELLRREIARGHVTLTARAEHDPAAGITIDEARFADYVRRLRALEQAHGLAPTLDAATVLRMPDVMSAEGTEEDAAAGEQLAAAAREAVKALAAMREREGARLAQLLAERLAVVEQAFERIAARAPQRLVAERERLQENVKALTGGVDLDPARVAQEIAVLADRLDVSEEVDRFRAHLAAFRETLAGGKGGGVGKRLGFLLQEMLREANTTGSKARDAAMLHDVVAVKEELERIAEQVENVE